ncbi:sodium:proton exchanger [Methylolobus aquaticus]|nr:sodium:proton exchanger [Methylolobus aquaticus]
MSHDALIQLASILVLGAAAQLAAWRFGIPSILLLLLTGIGAGPVTGLVHPDALLGELLLPIVSLSVAVILFEGGLSLDIRELRHIGGVLSRLTTLGVVVAWLITTITAHFMLGFRWGLAGLLGCILVVTGPTVIGPILRQLRLGGRIGSLLRWEGITIDPIGAIMAVMFFTAVRAGEFQAGTVNALQTVGLAAVVGCATGYIAGWVLIVSLTRFWIPDVLHSVVTLSLVIAASTTANLLQSESGLLAVTIMGIVVANQKQMAIQHIVEFKESITVVLISSLFIILTARLRWEELTAQGWLGLSFVLVLILLGRPAAVLLSTAGSALTWRERLFLCCMAPRGIVAVAVSSVFALEMVPLGYPQAGELEPVTLLVVFITVLVYGLGAAPLARALGLVAHNPQGILFAGAHAWARAIAQALQQAGQTVLLVDSDPNLVRAARMSGLPSFHGSILSEHTFNAIDYGGLSRLLAVTPNDATNALACMRFRDVFGRSEVYQLAPDSADPGALQSVSPHQLGRVLFGAGHTYANLAYCCGATPGVKCTRLTEAFQYQDFVAMHGDGVIPLFVLKPNGALIVFTSAETREPAAGDMLFSFVCTTREAAADHCE